jgi:hypothetical protein
MEVEWIADRANLRSLAREHPEWTQQDLADALGRCLSWVKKWLKRLREAPPDDLEVLLLKVNSFCRRIASWENRFIPRDAQRVRLPVIVTPGGVGSSKRLSFKEERRRAKTRSKRSQCLRYNGAEKEVVCFS